MRGLWNTAQRRIGVSKRSPVRGDAYKIAMKKLKLIKEEIQAFTVSSVKHCLSGQQRESWV